MESTHHPSLDKCQPEPVTNPSNLKLLQLLLQFLHLGVLFDVLRLQGWGIADSFDTLVRRWHISEASWPAACPPALR